SALVHSGVENVRVRRIDDDVARDGVLVGVKDFPPRLAAIGRLVDPPMLARIPERPDCSDPGYVRILWMGDDPCNLLRFGETDVLPCLAAVLRDVDSPSPSNRVSVVRLAGAHPNDIRVRGRNGYVAHRGGVQLIGNG